MPTLETTLEEELESSSHWDDAPVSAPKVEEFTTLAMELWLRASYPEVTAADEWIEEEELLGCHASCL
jgi:hypothetical protein